MAPRSAGDRLRNACLGYLVAAGDASAVRLAKAQFDAGQNMTDVLAALGILSSVDCPERLDALAAFYQAWRDDPLVLDKWFAIQALSPLPGTPSAVEALKSHPDFDLRNPNRVRALVSSFAGNQVRFHDASGAGYRLYADTIIQLDPTNGQVAARMVSPLGPMAAVRRRPSGSDEGGIATDPRSAGPVAEHVRDGIEEHRMTGFCDLPGSARPICGPRSMACRSTANSPPARWIRHGFSSTSRRMRCIWISMRASWRWPGRGARMARRCGCSPSPPWRRSRWSRRCMPIPQRVRHRRRRNRRPIA